MSDVLAEMSGTVWKIVAQVGAEVSEDDTLMILESMKMEIPVQAETSGTVREVLVAEGQLIAEGDRLVVIDQ